MNNFQAHAFVPRLHSIALKALNWLVPLRCFTCAKVLTENNTSAVCDACYVHLPFQENACNRCGQTIATQSDACGRCIKQTPPFDRCFCAFQYTSPIDEIIQAYKYSAHPEYAQKLALLFADEIISAGLPRPDVLIPVPLHRKRLFSRGYNQAALLSNHLAKILDIPCKTNALIKVNATAPQASLSLKARRRNVHGCFRLRKKIQGKHVAIIDDVLTTGATVSEISKVLKRNGVDYIQVWALTHTN